MSSFVDKNRKKIRLPEYDYSGFGMYFITICTYKKEKIFGNIEKGKMIYNEFGKIAFNEVAVTNLKRVDSNIRIIKFVIMPNHVHFLVEAVGTRLAVSSEEYNKFSNPIKNSISTVIGGYKSAVTRKINEYKAGHGKPCPYEIDKNGIVWQSRFYDRIIRDENEFLNVWNYIDLNPLKWELDDYYF
jgi:REP element-mobilizing transposase RayT